MATGLEIRAQIDSENVKGLLLINGGAAVALLAFLPTIIKDAGILIHPALVSLFVFQLGVIFALIHNHLRRICSLEYERQNYNPPVRPCVCSASIFFMWCSGLAFFVGGVVILIAGFISFP